MSRELLERALHGPDGPIEVTRVDVEVIGPDHFAWRLYSYERQIYSCTGSRRDVIAMAKCTGMFIGAVLGVPPWVFEPDASRN